MKQRRRASAVLGSAILFTAAHLTSCASAPDAVLETGGRNLHCPKGDLEVVLNRQTPAVREYAVACNFMYTRVHCTNAGCRPAPLEPPCVGNLPCFEEDPVTLEWRLPKFASVASTPKAAVRKHASGASTPKAAGERSRSEPRGQGPL